MRLPAEPQADIHGVCLTKNGVAKMTLILIHWSQCLGPTRDNVPDDEKPFERNAMMRIAVRAAHERGIGVNFSTGRPWRVVLSRTRLKHRRWWSWWS